MKKKHTIIIIVIASISLISAITALILYFYPKYKINTYYNAEKEDINEFEKQLKNRHHNTKGSETASDITSTEASVIQNNTNYSYKSKNYDGEINSVLKIPKINLKKAVYKGNDDYNLDHYLLVEGLIDMTLGESCYVIYGHDSRNTGASFSRLNELVINDEVFLQYSEGEFPYTVTEINTVTSDDVINLIDYDDSNALYLVTCEKKKIKGESDYRRRVITCKRKIS